MDKERRGLPEGWEWKRVEEIIEKVPLTGKKLKQSDYREVGKLPVIDQGQSFIGGYTDNEDLKVCCELPVVIFGDHTRAIKYVDFDFVAGADGIQVMKPQKIFDPKLFYYFVRAIQLPDKGYARHFQLLERSQIPLPPLSTQRRIVSILEKAEETKRLRAQADELTNRLLQSVFLEMFGDPMKNPKGWDTKDLGVYCSFLTSGSRGWAKFYSKEGAKFIRVQNLTGHRQSFEDIALITPPDTAETKRTKVKPKDLLISITGLVGLVAIVPEDIGDAYVSQHVAIVRLREEIESRFLAKFLAYPNGGQHQIMRRQYGQTKPGIGLEDIRAIRIFVPPLPLQQKFASIVEKVESMRQSQNQSKQQIEDLFSALMQKAFRGEI
jgi:type I restriction enzyme S subunit